VSAQSFAASINYSSGRYSATNYGRPPSNRYAVKFSTKTSTAPKPTTADVSTAAKDNNVVNQQTEAAQSSSLSQNHCDNDDTNGVQPGSHVVNGETNCSMATEPVVENHHEQPETTHEENGSCRDVDSTPIFDEPGQKSPPLQLKPKPHHHCNGSALITVGDDDLLVEPVVASAPEPVKPVIQQLTYSQRVASSLKKQLPPVETGGFATKKSATVVTSDRRNQNQNSGAKPSLSKLVQQSAQQQRVFDTGCQTEFPPVVEQQNGCIAGDHDDKRKPVLVANGFNKKPPPSLKKDINENIVVVKNGCTDKTSKVTTTNGVVASATTNENKSQPQPAAASKSWASLFNNRKGVTAHLVAVSNLSPALDDSAGLKNGSESSAVLEKHEPALKPALVPVATGPTTFDEISARKARCFKNATDSQCTSDLAVSKLGGDRSSIDLSIKNGLYMYKFAAFLKTYTLAHRGFPYQLRGLQNPGNWCFVNAALQALMACPPFVHLLRDMACVLPLRAPSATPSMDAMYI